MKKYIHACFLAFICLYRSKYTGIRKSCMDHPQRVRGKNSYSSPGLKEYPRPLLSWLYHFLFGNLEVKEPGCADHNRFRAVVFLGAHHPKTLSQLLNLASFILSIQCIAKKIIAFYKGLASRSHNSGFKSIPNRRRYLRDASRRVCVPSFTPMKGLVMIVLIGFLGANSLRFEDPTITDKQNSRDQKIEIHFTSKVDFEALENFYRSS